jgi:chromosome segregation ATPase
LEVEARIDQAVKEREAQLQQNFEDRLDVVQATMTKELNEVTALLESRTREVDRKNHRLRNLEANLTEAREARDRMEAKLTDANHRLNNRSITEKEFIKARVRDAIEMLSETEFVAEHGPELKIMIVEWYNTLVSLTSFPDVEGEAPEAKEKVPLPEGEQRWGSPKW